VVARVPQRTYRNRQGTGASMSRSEKVWNAIACICFVLLPFVFAWLGMLLAEIARNPI